MAKELEEAFDQGDVVCSGDEEFDDDGRVKRNGTLVTASAHIITAVIGSGVLSLAWAIAQLGWVFGPMVLIAFSVITWFCSSLLVDCYRSPDPLRKTGQEIIRRTVACLIFPENQVMKKASVIGVSTTTVFYMLCGVLGYAAFGNDAPGNFLTGFGFYDPFWLIDFANICIAIHLVGAYQVFCQPIYEFIESRVHNRYPDNAFLSNEHIFTIPLLGKFSMNFFRLTWRSAYVVITAVIAMIFPFFNDFLGLIGALAFWPLTVYFPVEMYIKQRKIRMFSKVWIWLQVLSMVCLGVSIAAVCGSVQGLVHSLKGYKPFKST